MPTGIDLEQRNWRTGNYDVGMIMNWQVDLANSTSSDAVISKKTDYAVCTEILWLLAAAAHGKIVGALGNCLLVFLPMKSVVIYLSLTDQMDEAGE